MLDPAFLASIGDLEFVAKVTVDGTISGLHRSPFHGYSAEFSQYRHYRPGDDLKYVDWKLFARTDRLHTKQYRETSNLLAEVVVDASGSMGFAGAVGPTKLAYARIIAGALAYLISEQGDSVGLVAYDQGLRTYLPSRPGRLHLRRTLVALSKLESTGGTASAVALKRAIDLVKRRGLLLLVSDLYDESDAVERELRRAVLVGHEVAVFHVLTREEIDFPFRRDVELQDLESGERRLASGTNAAAYRRQVDAFLQRWSDRCAANGIDYTRVTTDMPLETALRGYLLRRSGSPVR